MKNPFWRWVRLKEGREVFKAETTLRHADGTQVTVTVTGRNAAYVSAVINSIKEKFGGKASPKSADPWAPFEDLKRAADDLHKVMDDLKDNLPKGL